MNSVSQMIFLRLVQSKRCSTPAPDTSGADNLDISNIVYPQNHSSAQLSPTDQSRAETEDVTPGVQTNKLKRKISHPEYGSAQPNRKIKFNLPDQLWDDSGGI